MRFLSWAGQNFIFAAVAVFLLGAGAVSSFAGVLNNAADLSLSKRFDGVPLNFIRHGSTAVEVGVPFGMGGLARKAGKYFGPKLANSIGKAAGFRGAAARSYGLAYLGGGSLASGGFGMAGGEAVIDTALAAGQTGLNSAAQLILDSRVSIDRKNIGTRGIHFPDFPNFDETAIADCIAQLLALQRNKDAAITMTRKKRKECVRLRDLTKLRLSIALETSEPNSEEEQVLLTQLAIIALNEGKSNRARHLSERSIRSWHKAFAEFNLRSFVSSAIRTECEKGPMPANGNDFAAIYLTDDCAPQTSKTYSIPVLIWSIASASDLSIDLTTSLRALKLAISIEPDHEKILTAMQYYLQAAISRISLENADRPMQLSTVYWEVISILRHAGVPDHIRFGGYRAFGQNMILDAAIEVERASRLIAGLRTGSLKYEGIKNQAVKIATVSHRIAGLNALVKLLEIEILPFAKLVERLSEEKSDPWKNGSRTAAISVVKNDSARLASQFSEILQDEQFAK